MNKRGLFVCGIAAVVTLRATQANNVLLGLLGLLMAITGTIIVLRDAGEYARKPRGGGMRDEE